MKKLFVLVFAIALCLGVLCFGASADGITPSQPTGSGTEEAPYQIGTAAELYWFAQSGGSSASAVLTADIIINENVLNAEGSLNGTPTRTWTPIGSSSNSYSGTFDGQGHTISGLYTMVKTDNTTTAYAGLFGCVGGGGVVKNVNIADSYIYASIKSSNPGSDKYVAAGSVCGKNYGTIENCTNSGTVVVKDGNTSNSACYAGGVCGLSTHTITDKGKISGCANSGSVSGYGYVGGVCGGNLSDLGMENCTNSGSVSGYGHVGGVCGSTNHSTVNCGNTGSVSGDGDIGGVCGYNNSGTITNCFSTGSVSGDGYIGGVCGYNYDGTITNCYWLDTAYSGTGIGDGGGTVANVESKSAEQFASGEVAWLLNSSTNGPWRQNLGEGGDGFPTLDSGHKAVVKLTVDGEVSYLNSGDKFEGEDGKVYYDNKGERAEVPCVVTADTTLTSKTLVTVRADSFDCFVGDDKPTLTYTTSPVVEGLNVTLECDANMYAVGEYTITISGLETDGSYAFDYVDGVLKVRDSWVVTVDGEVNYIHPGESFTLPDAPKNSGYIFLGWRCGDETYKAGETIEVTSDMSFTSVWGNLPDVDPGEPEPEPELPFYDVAKGDWFYDAVKYVYYADLMDGVEEHIFAPNDTLTRAMVWTIIARAEGVDTDGGASWYAKAQEWVEAKGISDGENPSAAITRQELVTMLWRLAGEPVVNYALTAPDADAISGWAYEAMRWAVSEGIIEGDENGLIHPTATCTRAEAAAILMRLG